MNDYELQNLALLNRIANALEAIALTNAPAPNFVKPIEVYADYDYTSIGAMVRARDANGPTELEWGGYTWTRRSPQNKFGEAIWFSRCIGKDPEGNNKYARLITFKRMSEAEPLPRKVEAIVQHDQPPKPTEPPASELDAHFGAPKVSAAPDYCALHDVTMTEISSKSGQPYHRLVLEDGRAAFCNSVEIKAANGKATH